MKIKPIKQIDDSACGPTCIKMTVDYFKLSNSLEDINILSDYKNKDGLYNNDIVDVLNKIGLKTNIKNNATWNDLIKYNSDEKVIIVSWMLRGYIGHVSVVDKVTKEHIYLADSEDGEIIKMDKVVFLRLWHDYEPNGIPIKGWSPVKNIDIQLRWMVVVTNH